MGVQGAGLAVALWPSTTSDRSANNVNCFDPGTESSSADYERIMTNADAAAPILAGSSVGARASTLRAVAKGLLSHEAELVPLARQDSGLGAERLSAELLRTALQLGRVSHMASEARDSLRP